MSWPAVAAAAARPGSTVLWPMGATEQHGPHLPLATDALFADRLADAVLARLPETAPIWRLPVQWLGFSPEHLGFAGTLSLGAEAMIALVCGVGEQLADSGFRRLVLFNAHGGQIALLEVAARELRRRRPQLAVLPTFLWRGAALAELIPAPERRHGLHAGLAETSLMLHLAPELVGSQRQADGQLAAPPPPGWSLEGAIPTAWLSHDISRSGVIGDPGGADAALGAQLEAALCDGWTRLLEGLLASDWPPLAGGQGPAPL
ncbi:MAG: creatininase family protein [Synechococcus sp.]|nr:creatininase family protein [Synechococcus sp.]